MKRLTLRQFLRQRRLGRYRALERLKRSLRRYVPRGNRYVPPGEEIRAPDKFDLTRGSAIAVCKFLRAVSAAVLERRLAVRLNFRFTESFYPAGTILLFAEIDRIVSLSDLPKPITIIDPRMRRPREVLKQIGIHTVTGDKCDVIPERDDVVYWKALKGADQSGHQMALLEAVADKVNAQHAKQLELSGIWRGVSEAVGNTVEHAYLYPRSDEFSGLPGTKWWMFTQLRDGVFTVAVCDLGCGYGSTVERRLPEQFLSTFLSPFGGRSTDALAIQAAMEYGKTRTKRSERGKGSRDAMSVLSKHGNGDLLIMSNRGVVQYRYRGGRQQSQTPAAMDIDIRGTIVMWKLPLKEVEDEHS